MLLLNWINYPVADVIAIGHQGLNRRDRSGERGLGRLIPLPVQQGKYSQISSGWRCAVATYATSNVERFSPKPHASLIRAQSNRNPTCSRASIVVPARNARNPARAGAGFSNARPPGEPRFGLQKCQPKLAE